MSVSAMNHFTVVTDDLKAAEDFYAMLGLVSGPRPPLPLPGLWLYAGGQPILHVIQRDQLPPPQGLLDHMALTASGLAGIVKKLQEAGCPIDLRRVPGYGTWQLFTRDPKGVRVELDFDKGETAPAGYEHL